MAYVRPEVPSQNFQGKREFKTTGNIEQKLLWSIQDSNSKSVVSIRHKGNRTMRNTKTGKPVLTCQQTTLWKKLSFDKRQRQMHRGGEAETQWSWELGGISAWGLWRDFLKEVSSWGDCGGRMNMNYAEGWMEGWEVSRCERIMYLGSGN